MLHWRLLFLLLFASPAFAQRPAPNTYAVIAGISSYASKGIPALRFANRDAEAFNKYLLDEKVPAANIKLLLNEEATTASIYSALSWLNETAAKDDLVYFYFSGHGDMESETIYKLGFLLTYNTPRTNYINNAIRIEDINNFANTLSLKNKAKVVIITDACHSGNLAGSDFRGNSLVGRSLSISKANEIRIASCRPDQLSMEDEGWGGGRGVFSFHLINGLTGFAAKRGNDIITVKDLRSYLDSSLAKDAILKRENHQQNAVIDGPDIFPLAKKNAARVSQISREGSNTAGATPPMLQSGAEETIDMMMDEFASWVKKQQLDIGFDYAALQMLPKHAISAGWLDMWKGRIDSLFKTSRDDQKPLLTNMLKRVETMRPVIASDSNLRKQMDRIFAISIHDYAQNMINDYLEGDAAELERRRYYNAGASGYEVYPVMYDLAMKLTEPDDYLYRILEVNRYYFGGLALLVKIPMTADPVPLVDEAMKLEKKALELEENAPYIYNTLGTLYFYKGEFAMADSMYRKASSMAPQWALPYNNLLGLYIAQNKIDKASAIYPQAAEKGYELPDFYTNVGLLKEIQGDYLLAEEMQRKSIFLNSRHFLPFERLGNIYTHTTNYALADSFYFEADVRKRGYHFKKFIHSTVAAPFMLPETILTVCDFDSTKINKNDAAGYFTWGMYYFAQRNFMAAEQKWKRLIQMEPQHPLAFYYLGKIQFDKKNWAEADLMYRFSINNHLEQKAALDHQETLLKGSAAKDKDCFRKTFVEAWYPKENAHAYLGTVYREWHHYTAAEHQFLQLLALQPWDFAVHKVLWKMWEDIGKYHDAEALMKRYGNIDARASDNELNAFYKRMISRYPNQADWYLKAGMFLYTVVRNYPAEFEKDRKRIFPDQKFPEQVQLDREIVSAAAIPTKLAGTNERILYESPIVRPYSDAISFLSTADSLIGNNPALTADINDKLGDLYLWQGVPQYAAKYYQASIDAAPENSGVREKLIDAYHITYQYSDALNNLHYLKERQELNLEKMLLLADYTMRRSKFGSADSLLQQVKNIYPYPLAAAIDLQARNYLLQEKADIAIKQYELLLTNDAANNSAMYSISRMYALKNDKTKSLLWLHKAYDHGFNYKWVLDNDPLMMNMRKTNEWQVFVGSKQFLQYPEPTNTFPRASTE